MHSGTPLCTRKNKNGRFLNEWGPAIIISSDDYSTTIGFKKSGLYLFYEKLDGFLHGLKIIFNGREYQVAINVEVAVSYVVALMT